MVIKTQGHDFQTMPALAAAHVGGTAAGWRSMTHACGWTVRGYVHQGFVADAGGTTMLDNFWVNRFLATHPTLGVVRGAFAERVYASSEEAFADFFARFAPAALTGEEWMELYG